MTMKYLRKQDLADRYGVTIRTIDNWAEAGELPKPIYRRRFPLWNADTIGKQDRAALKQRALERHQK